MKPLKTKVSITLDTDLLEIVKGLAEQDDRSLSQTTALKVSIGKLNFQKKKYKILFQST